ncbi:MAG TPA: hypothetical protein VN784_08200 [Candidatus Limnocylindrales bacterium]|nr:hypothetical protein [Candidatus Limnocylindrales bacterium]
MSNYTLSVATLAVTLSHVATRVAQSKLAPLSAYGTIIPIEEPFLKGLDSVIPFVTAAPPTQILSRGDTPDYQATGTITSPIAASPKLFLQPISVENAFYQGGDRLVYAAEFAIRQLCNSIIDSVKANIKTSVFGLPAVTVASSAWTEDNFATLAASIDSERRAVVLDKSYALKTPTVWLPASGNCTVYECNRWTAGTNIVGFAACPQAFVFRWASPDISMNERRVVYSQLIPLPQLGGLQIESSIWMALDSRSLSAAYRVFFAATPADTNALAILTSA